MTTGGWLFMLGSLAFVWGLAIWCVHRWLASPDAAGSPEPDERRDDGSADA